MLSSNGLGPPKARPSGLLLTGPSPTTIVGLPVADAEHGLRAALRNRAAGAAGRHRLAQYVPVQRADVDTRTLMGYGRGATTVRLRPGFNGGTRLQAFSASLWTHGSASPSADWPGRYRFRGAFGRLRRSIGSGHQTRTTPISASTSHARRASRSRLISGNLRAPRGELACLAALIASDHHDVLPARCGRRYSAQADVLEAVRFRSRMARRLSAAHLHDVAGAPAAPRSVLLSRHHRQPALAGRPRVMLRQAPPDAPTATK